MTGGAYAARTCRPGVVAVGGRPRAAAGAGPLSAQGFTARGHTPARGSWLRGLEGKCFPIGQRVALQLQSGPSHAWRAEVASSGPSCKQQACGCVCASERSRRPHHAMVGVVRGDEHMVRYGFRRRRWQLTCVPRRGGCICMGAVRVGCRRMENMSRRARTVPNRRGAWKSMWQQPGHAHVFVCTQHVVNR